MVKDVSWDGRRIQIAVLGLVGRSAGGPKKSFEKTENRRAKTIQNGCGKNKGA